MTSRSLPRMVPGARLGAHVLASSTLVTNDNASPLPSVDEPAASATGTNQAPPLPRPARVVWLADMLVPERNSFGVLRLLMALAVVVSHAVFLVAGQSAAEPLYRWTGYTLGQHGVQVFFFLSGILVAQSLMKSESVRDYATARALRIFPALIVCVLLTALALGPWLSTLAPVAYLNDKIVARYLVKTLSLMTGSAPLPGLFENAPGDAKGIVNSSLWTLKYEVLCYVALALVGWLAIRTKAYREIAAAAIAGWLALVLVQRVGIELGSQKPAFDVFRYFALFFGAGAVAYSLRGWIPIHGALLLPLALALAASIGTRFAEPVMAVTLGYAALWLATFEFWGLRGYTNRSDYSYGTYIYGMPVSQAVLTFVPQMHWISLALVTTGIVLMLAFLSWELVERPALALRHRLRRREILKPVEPECQPASPIAAAAEKPRTLSVDEALQRVRGAPAAHAPAVRAARITPLRRPIAAGQPVRAPASQVITPAVATSPAKAEPPPQTSQPAVAMSPEPGLARPWRPVSSPIRLQVASERRDPASENAEPPRADVPRSRIAFALDPTPAAAKSAKPGSPSPEAAGSHGHASEAAPPRPRARPGSSWRPIDPPRKSPV